LGFTRETVETTLEKRIVIGLIVSTDYIIKIKEMFRLEYFQNEYHEVIAKWCMEYFETYEKAPMESIQDIFLANRDHIEPDQLTLISRILTDASKRFENEQGINVPLLYDDTILYFKKQSLTLLNAELRYLLSKDKVKEAEDRVLGFHKVSKTTSQWVNPFSEQSVHRYFQMPDEVFFQFPGALGEFLGDYKRGWLVGISAPFKRGKTWLAQEFAILAYLNQLKVAFFSLEMSEETTEQRLYKRLTGTWDDGGELKYPIFDCLLNQDDSCVMHQRENHVKLFDEEGRKPEWKKNDPNPMPQYRPCSFCRNHENREWGEQYKKDVWYEMIDRPMIESASVAQQVRSLEDMYGDNFRFMAYPRFTANLADIKRDLYLLEKTEDFIPDMIVIDYADILKPEQGGLIGVEKEDRTWIALSQLAAEKKALVVTPTQVNKEALDAVQVRQSHTAKWVCKLGHVDAMIALSQTEAEKKAKVIRISTLLHRHNDCGDETCMVLQNLDAGQMVVDSEWR